MILVDTSAWIEFLRDTGSAVCNRVDELIGARLPCAIRSAWRCSPAPGMNVTCGAFGGLLARAALLPTVPADYDEAAALYLACRGRGETVRRLIDCLIGSIAIRAGAAVLHNDRDFDVLARHTGLRVEPLH